MDGVRGAKFAQIIDVCPVVVIVINNNFKFGKFILKSRLYPSNLYVWD